MRNTFDKLVGVPVFVYFEQLSKTQKTEVVCMGKFI